MVVNDNACDLDKRGALESIASRLAPPGMALHPPEPARDDLDPDTIILPDIPSFTRARYPFS
jgi:hypothetical protein